MSSAVIVYRQHCYVLVGYGLVNIAITQSVMVYSNNCHARCSYGLQSIRHVRYSYDFQSKLSCLMPLQFTYNTINTVLSGEVMA